LANFIKVSSMVLSTALRALGIREQAMAPFLDKVCGARISQLQVGEEDLKPDQVPDEAAIML
jgi:hypothetical protein